MKKLTTPESILIGLGLIACAILLRIDGTEFIMPDAHAEVAGMDYTDLRRDYDFKKAVRYVVESDCQVDGSDITC